MITLKGLIENEGSRLVRQSITPSIVAIIQSGKTRSVVAHGSVSINCDLQKSVEASVNSIYDIASMTKIVSTWPAIGKLLQSGMLSLDDRIDSLFGLHISTSKLVTVRSILTHTSELMSATWISQYGGARGVDLAKLILSEDSEKNLIPDQAVYINRGFILLGLLVEYLTSQTLDNFVSESIWKPLGMSSTMYGPLVGRIENRSVAPSEFDSALGHHLCGVVHDENCRFLGGVAGHAGVFSSASDIEIFAQACLNGVLSDLIGGSFVDAALSGPFVNWKDGGRVRSLGWAADTSGKQIVAYHDGFTGVGLYLAPQAKRYVVLMTNSVFYERRSPTLLNFRERIISALANFE